MISKKMQAAFNEQITEELYSSNIYMSMAYHMEGLGYEGCAHWLIKQSDEELQHAREMASFVVSRGGKVEMRAIQAVKDEWKNPLQLFEAVYEHECHISQCINDLLDKAREEGDKAAEEFFWHFVREQVEEEATSGGIVDKLKNNGEGAIILLDHVMASR